MDLSIIFLIQIVVTLLFCIQAAYMDLKFGIIPNNLNLFLIIFGIFSNLILSIFSTNVKFILVSIISMVVTFIITFMMWKLNIWGGGDVKLFTAIATVIPSAQNIGFLGIFPAASFYPFFITLILNSFIVSFPFLFAFMIFALYKNINFKNDKMLFLTLMDINTLFILIKTYFNKFIKIKNLEEGMIVNNYYFNNKHVYDTLNELNGNLSVYCCNDSDYEFYFKSGSSGGLTSEDVTILKVLNMQGFINKDVSIKVSFPFAPSIALAFLLAVTFGDLIVVFSKFFSFVI